MGLDEKIKRSKATKTMMAKRPVLRWGIILGAFNYPKDLQRGLQGTQGAMSRKILETCSTGRSRDTAPAVVMRFGDGPAQMRPDAVNFLQKEQEMSGRLKE